jgi:hypothetical protein
VILLTACSVSSNKALQRTEQSVTYFACAKRAPFCPAAELGRYTSLI